LLKYILKINDNVSFLFLNEKKKKNLQFPYDVIICRPTRGGHSRLLATIAVQGVAAGYHTGHGRDII
jgi:hypothetical protein